MRLDLIGGFQADNALVAAGLAIGSGSDAAAVIGALPGLRTVRGRMERAATARQRRGGLRRLCPHARRADHGAGARCGRT